SAWGPVRPPRCRRPEKEKTISVGTLHSIPSSSHMIDGSAATIARARSGVTYYPAAHAEHRDGEPAGAAARRGAAAQRAAGGAGAAAPRGGGQGALGADVVRARQGIEAAVGDLDALLVDRARQPGDDLPDAREHRAV